MKNIQLLSLFIGFVAGTTLNASEFLKPKETVVVDNKNGIKITKKAIYFDWYMEIVEPLNNSNGIALIRKPGDVHLKFDYSKPGRFVVQENVRPVFDCTKPEGTSEDFVRKVCADLKEKFDTYLKSHPGQQ